MVTTDDLAVIVVTRNSAHHLPSLMSALVEQLQGTDEFVVVDNDSSDGTAQTACSISDRVTVLETGANLGFAGGCAEGARATRAGLMLFLNPDCKPHEACIAELRAAARIHADWAAWQAAVMLPDGNINSSGGVVHYLGIGWAGNCLRPPDWLPSDPSEVAFPSGAAMVVRRQVWDDVGGFDPWYFMYGEDLDLGLRLWLSGHRVGVVPSARVTHGYEFLKGSRKWYWLERNRWRTILSVYPAILILLLSPALLASELVLLAVAARDGWLAAKVRAQASVIAGLPRTWQRRRRVQAMRETDVAAFAARLTALVDSPFAVVARHSWPYRAQCAYWDRVRWTLDRLSR